VSRQPPGLCCTLFRVADERATPLEHALDRLVRHPTQRSRTSMTSPFGALCWGLNHHQHRAPGDVSYCVSSVTGVWDFPGHCWGHPWPTSATCGYIAMARDSLLVRRRDADDRRLVRLHLTQRGAAVRNRIDRASQRLSDARWPRSVPLNRSATTWPTPAPSKTRD
jgi:hypothetical protein